MLIISIFDRQSFSIPILCYIYIIILECREGKETKVEVKNVSN